MKAKILKISYIFFFLFNFFAFTSLLNTAKAVCPENAVIDVLDPECEREEVTIGGLANRFIRLVPYAITVVGIIGITKGSFKIMNADGDDDKKEGFQSVIRTALGAGLFYSIWMILYLVEQFTGANILRIG